MHKSLSKQAESGLRLNKAAGLESIELFEDSRNKQYIEASKKSNSQSWARIQISTIRTKRTPKMPPGL